jgi:hypothetical protein
MRGPVAAIGVIAGRIPRTRRRADGLHRGRRQIIGNERGDRGQVHESLSQHVGRIMLAGCEGSLCSQDGPHTGQQHVLVAATGSV